MWELIISLCVTAYFIGLGILFYALFTDKRSDPQKHFKAIPWPWLRDFVAMALVITWPPWAAWHYIWEYMQSEDQRG